MSVKMSERLISFSIFQELLKTLIPILKEVIILEKDAKFLDYNFIFIEVKKDLIGAIGFLSRGYNNFLTSQKINCYNLVREKLSNVQSNLIILNELNVFSNEQRKIYFDILENNIIMCSHLIKKMETKNKTKSVNS
ncbi:hypothetical protein M0P25_05145 [archaeon]|nr:hypothetical protein [archaeon]MDD2477899.1 hypothetical protein [Candidatus ainarchaeum sp.]MDD3084474.1 hypothetical protein [Candidatus ainarchaeum sp.]MDD4220936.1 hypothetical protein [Candidatus ainarchaeum sp.]MDD4662883.1 hypothetical protein [Candidatus ainarchaeum sp.]